VRDPGRPVESGRLVGDFGTVAASGGFVYVGAANNGGVAVVDARNPAELRQIVDLSLGGVPRQLAVSGNRLLALTPDILYVLDASDPVSPRPLGQMEVSVEEPSGIAPGKGRGMAVRGDVVYLASYGGLQVVDVHDGTEPRRLSVRQVPSIGLGTMGSVGIRVPSGGDVAVAGHTVLFAGDGTGTWTFGAGTPDGMTEVFEGRYRANFEYSDFSPDYAGCPPDDKWWYLVPTDEFRQRYDALRPDCARGTGGDGCYVRARFEGRVTPPMTAGVTWYRSPSVTVTRLIDMWRGSDCPGPARDLARLYLPRALSASD
jgi:hypothetical protein